MKMLKKSLSVILAIMLVLSMCSATVFAEDESITIDARENVADFGDNASAGGQDTTPETPEEWAHGGYILRSGEWIKYNLPAGLKKGTYELSAKIANYTDSCIKVVVNDGTDAMYEAAPDIVSKSVNPETGGADGSMQFFTERVLGKVVLGGDNNTLTFKYGKWYAYVLKSFSLKYVSDVETFEVHFKEPAAYVHKNGNNTVSINEYISNGTNILPEVMTLRPGADNYYTLDVSFMPSGTYAIGVESASNAVFKVDLYTGKTIESANGLRKSNFVIPNASGWNVMAESGVIDEVYFDENAKYLKIDPVSTSGAVQVYAITFTKVKKDNFEVNAQYDCVDYSHESTNALFYSVTMNTPTIVSQGIATMRYDATKYCTYDVMGIESGTYKVYADYISAQNFKFDLYYGDALDDVSTVAETDLLLKANGTWTDDFYLTSDEICSVYIPAGVSYIKVEPTSGTTQLGKIKFEKISSENLIDYVVPYNRTISNVAGEGFYAKNGNTVLDNFEPAIATLSTSMTAVRAGNWYKYDISHIPAGKYTLLIDGASYLGNTAIDISVNDELVLDNAAIYSSGAYNAIGTPLKVAVAKIEIPEIAEENAKNILMLKGAVNAFNLKSIIFSKNPQVNVIYERGADLHKTLGSDVVAGTMYFDAFAGTEYADKDVLATFAVYKTNNETGAKQLYKAYTEVSEDGTVSGKVDGIEIEDGYTYSQKVFIWDNASLMGFSK